MTGVLPPASDMTIALFPDRRARSMSMSSGRAWETSPSRTVARHTYEGWPVTTMDDGYGDAAPASGITIPESLQNRTGGGREPEPAWQCPPPHWSAIVHGS